MSDGYTFVPVTDRSGVALRQAGLMTVALLVAAQVTERLRPDETAERGLVTTSFLWAIVVWLAALVLHAVAFERSQLRQLERTPFFAALGIGGFVLVTGLATFDAGTAGRRLLYLFANSLGAVLFWWGLLSLGYLVAARANLLVGEGD